MLISVPPEDEQPRVQCPGPKGRGCSAMLRLYASICTTCGETFALHELWAAYAEQVGSDA